MSFGSPLSRTSLQFAFVGCADGASRIFDAFRPGQTNWSALFRLRPTDPPPPDVVECSLFGPGVGVCKVIHLGHGRWAIVDSCLDRDSRKPAALVYLEQIGVAASDVSLVIASHWHDDHIQGLPQVLAACNRARFVCSAAMNCKELWSLLAAAELSTNQDRGIREVNRAFRTLFERRERDRLVPKLLCMTNLGWIGPQLKFGRSARHRRR